MRPKRDRLLAVGARNAYAAHQIGVQGIEAALAAVDTMAGVTQRLGVAKSLLAAVRRVGPVPPHRVTGGRLEIPLLTWHYEEQRQVGVVRWISVGRTRQARPESPTSIGANDDRGVFSVGDRCGKFLSF